MDPTFAVAAALMMGGSAILYRSYAKANAAAAAERADAYQRQCDETNNWILEHRNRGGPPEMICGSVPVGFDNDERVLCVLPGVELLEPRAVRRSIRHGRSAYGGPTIRLARGVSFRLGASGSTGVSESESFDEMRQIDHGTLILTTKRLAFLGSLRTNSSSLDDLIGIEDVGNGIQVHRERKQKAETYVLTDALTVDGLEITGSMMQLAIEMAKLTQEVDALEAAPAWAEGGAPHPIVLCVTCRSKDISCLRRESNAVTFVCNDCGTALEQVGDQYKLTHVTDTGTSVWQKYADKILHRREWSNIALGGYSDEELTIMWAVPRQPI